MGSRQDHPDDLPGIREYGLLSDCHAPALVSLDGSVDWWCPPRADQPSVFARILDPAAGHWSLTAVEAVDVRRRYVEDTLVLETTITTEGGVARVRECLAFAAGSRGHEIGFDVPQMLVRSVEGVEGRVALRCEFAPRFEYGLTVPHLDAEPGVVVAEGGAVRLRLTTPIELAIEAGTASSTFTVEQGQHLAFGLAYAPRHGKDSASTLDPDDALQEAIDGWQSWVEAHTPYEGPHAEVVQLGALVLQGLTYQPSGAVLAAASTSLPAALGGTDNWDYRYAWLRDLSLTAQALWVAACPDEVGRFLRFITDAAGRPTGDDRVQIMYGLDGRRWLPEHELTHLRGHAGSRPVRVGNAAWDQSQLDVMGEVLDLSLQYRDQLEPLDPRTRDLLLWMVREAESTWTSKDAGMWEARDGGRHYTTSKVMCWVALDRAIQLADLLEAEDEIERWQATAAEVRATVLERAWNDDIGAFAGALGSDRLDASVLLMPIVGFIEAGEERMLSTIDAIQDKLVCDGLVYRWDGDANGFVICTAWLVECLAMAGRRDEAVDLMDRLVARGNDVGLYAEQIEPFTGRHVGNFPQAFSHVGLINAAWRLEQTQDRG